MAYVRFESSCANTDDIVTKWEGTGPQAPVLRWTQYIRCDAYIWAHVAFISGGRFKSSLCQLYIHVKLLEGSTNYRWTVGSNPTMNTEG